MLPKPCFFISTSEIQDRRELRSFCLLRRSGLARPYNLQRRQLSHSLTPPLKLEIYWGNLLHATYWIQHSCIQLRWYSKATYCMKCHCSGMRRNELHLDSEASLVVLLQLVAGIELSSIARQLVERWIQLVVSYDIRSNLLNSTSCFQEVAPYNIGFTNRGGGGSTTCYSGHVSSWS